MKRLLFKKWNWQFDHGVSPLDDGKPIPADYCIAIEDDSNRLCRVIVHKSSDLKSSEPPTIYDYFCSSDGRVLQKRSYSDNGEIDLIIEYSYSEPGWVVETAVSDDGGPSRSIRRRIEP